MFTADELRAFLERFVDVGRKFAAAHHDPHEQEIAQAAKRFIEREDVGELIRRASEGE